MIRVLLVDPRPHHDRCFSGPDWQDEDISLFPVAAADDVITAFSKESYDIVISHESIGTEVLLMIDSQDPPVPCILFSETGDDDAAAGALRSGADYYLGNVTERNCRKLLVPLIKKLVLHSRTDERIRNDNAIMQAIHDASPFAACVIRDHVILWMNAMMPQMLGYEESELIGTDPVHLFPDDDEHRRIDAGLFSGRDDDGWGDVEGQLKRKDGSLMSCHLLSRPLDVSDPKKGNIIIGQDISDYVRMRTMLRKSEVQYQNLMDSASSIVLRVDTTGAIRFINKAGAAFFGYNPDELTGKNLVETILPRKSRTGRDLARMVHEVIQNPEEFEVNVNENMKRNGERVWIAWTNRAIRDEAGRVIELISVGTDITDRKIDAAESSLTLAPWISMVLEDTDINEDVFDAMYAISVELSREGREGKPIGTTFLIGDAEEVLRKSTQLILNPFEGHPFSARNVRNPEVRETIKELSQIDGAFVVSGTGVVEAAGRYITIDTSRASIPKGLGTRHASVAGITGETQAVGIVISQSGGKISVFKNGRIFRVIAVRE
ncbi:MAG: PAS domain S-box protein [Methanoregulaceae archaeon]|nr:PAS domain S-box protein [Methanoregulaceae archaeon]